MRLHTIITVASANTELMARDDSTAVPLDGAPGGLKGMSVVDESDNLTFDSLKAAVAALGPKPPTFEIWSLANFPRFDDQGQPLIMKCAASALDSIWASVTGADFIILMNPLTLSDLAIDSFHNIPEAERPVMFDPGIPIFDDEALRNHQKMNLRIKPRRPLLSFNDYSGGTD